MYGPYLPRQMGLRQPGIPRRRETDNMFVIGPRARSRRSTAGPVTRRRSDGTVIVETVQAERIGRVSKPRKVLTQAERVWYDCPCGKQTRNANGKCDHPGVTFLGVDNIGKDHL